jgi:CRISPR/Cas system-associated endonuclease Cas1
MLTRPEIKAKQFVVMTVEPGKSARLNLKNKNLVYKVDDKIVRQCSLDRVLLLFIIGDTSITTNLIRELDKFGAKTCLLGDNLKQYAEFGYETQANYARELGNTKWMQMMTLS